MGFTDDHRKPLSRGAPGLPGGLSSSFRWVVCKQGTHVRRDGSYAPARAAFTKSTCTPSNAFALFPNGRAPESPLPAGPGWRRSGRGGSSREQQGAASPQLSPAVQPSRPGVWAEPSLPRLRERGSARGNSPRSHRGRFPGPRQQKGSGTPHLLRHPAVRSGNNPSGESRRYLVRRRPPVPPGRAGLPGSAGQRPERRAGAARGPPLACPGPLPGPGSAPRWMKERIVPRPGRLRRWQRSRSARGLCRGWARPLRRPPELFPLIVPPGEAQRDPLCRREYIVLFSPSQAVVFWVFVELPEHCHSAWAAAPAAGRGTPAIAGRWGTSGFLPDRKSLMSAARQGCFQQKNTSLSKTNLSAGSLGWNYRPYTPVYCLRGISCWQDILANIWQREHSSLNTLSRTVFADHSPPALSNSICNGSSKQVSFLCSHLNSDQQPSKGYLYEQQLRAPHTLDCSCLPVQLCS